MAPIFLALAQLVPSLLRLKGKDAAAAVADEGIAVARRLTGKEEPDAALEVLRAKPELLAQFQAQINDVVIAELDAETRRLEAVNATMRAEAQSKDPFVRRARPMFLYVIGFTWALQTIGFFIAVVWKPQHAATILAAIGDLAFMWTIALSVVGVYVKVRSDDKKTAAGEAPPTALEAIANLVRRK